MSVFIWEWDVDSPGERKSLGVSSSAAKAMNSLSDALLEAGESADGHITLTAVIDSADGWHYNRLAKTCEAHHEKGVISWKETFLRVPA